LWCPGANPGECAGLEISSRSLKGNEFEQGGTGLSKMGAIKAIYPKCGSSYYDLGRYNPICKECGSDLESSEDALADRIYDISIVSRENKIPRTRDLEITIDS